MLATRKLSVGTRGGKPEYSANRRAIGAFNLQWQRRKVVITRRNSVQDKGFQNMDAIRVESVMVGEIFAIEKVDGWDV